MEGDQPEEKFASGASGLPVPGMVRAHRAGRRSGTAGHPGREPTERLGDADRAWLPHTRWRRSSIKGSEFSSILKRSGPEELIATLERQTEQLARK